MRYTSLSLSRLKELLNYDPETGLFTWKVRPFRNSRKKAGDEAGGLKGDGYRYIGVDSCSYLGSQLAWFYVTGEWAPGEVGVKNGVPSDLRFENLKPSQAPAGDHGTTTKEGRAQYRRAQRDENPLVHRQYGWKRYYGITSEDYQRMFAAQGGNCAICKKPERAKSPSTGETKWLSVDHDHATSAVRSLLCSSCNHTLGHVGDDPEVLEAAAAYLRHHKEKVN